MVVTVKGRGRAGRRLPALRSDAERNALVEANLSLACWYVNRHAGVLGPGDEPDALAACQAGLLRAAELYDPARGAFSTYAAAWMRNRMGKFLARRRRERQGEVRLGGRSLELLPAPERHGGASLEALDGLLSLVRHDGARQALRLRYGLGLTYAEAAARMGLTRQRACQLCQAGREELRAALA